MTISVEESLKQSDMFLSFDEAVQIKYRRKLLGQLNKRLSISPPKEDLSSILINNDNSKEFQKILSSISSFSWLGFFFSSSWAAYKNVPMPYILISLLFLPAWPFLFFDYDIYLTITNILGFGAFGLAALYGFNGRSLAISDEIARYLKFRNGFTNVSVMPPITMVGSQIGNPWLRVLAIILFTFALAGIEFYLDISIWGWYY
jgi:hypothetical protein